MSTNSTSCREIIVAWALPVSVAQLGARLLAYAETKAAITTFRIVTGHTNLIACPKLPQKLVSMIASKVRDIAFEQRMKEWVKITDLDSLAGIVSSNWAENDEWLAEQFLEEAAEAHEKDVMRYCRILTSLKGSSRFAKCVKIFTRDFGIQPYFMVHKIYNRHGYGIEEVLAKAYLTLPLLSAPMLSGPGPGFASFSVSSVLNPSALVEPTEGQLQRFKSATSILNLHVYSPDEDETNFEDRSTTREAPRSDGDTNSGESEDSDNDSNGVESNGAGIERPQNDSAKNYGADSGGVKSDGVMLQGQQTAMVTEADKSFGASQEPATEQADHSADRDAELGEEEDEDDEYEEARWPELMILGCGELQADNLEYQ